MPAPQPKKKPGSSSVQTEILKELRALNDSVEDLHDFLELTAKKQKRRRVTNGLLNGILNAVGVIFGTLVMTVLLVYAGQALIRSQAFQDWAQQAFEKAVSNAIKDEIRSFGN